MQVRALASEEEVDAWAAFCASCFADKKPVPPSAAFFRAHYELDPSQGPAALSRMHVTMDGPAMLSSVCVYGRNVCVDGRVVSVGGIGDVCTAAAARGQGLCKRALQASLETMRQQAMSLSALHAGPHVAPLYAALGWRSASLVWRPVTLLPVPETSEAPGPAVVREASPADTADALLLAALHGPYALRFNGPVARGPEYWSRWVAGQLGGDRYWVLSDIDEAGGQTLRALLCVQRYRGALKVRDFAACPRDLAADGGCTAFAQLARHALAVSPLAPAADTADTPPRMLVPAPIAAEFTAGGGEAAAGVSVAPLGAADESEDCGWMYRTVPAAEGQGAVAEDEHDRLLGCLLAGGAHEERHLVFPIDHF